MAWPATAMIVRFEGPSLVVRMRDVPRADSTPETDLVDVTVDGAAPRRLALRAGEARYWLAAHLARGAHEVRLFKRTEAEVGTLEVRGIGSGSGGRLLPPARRPARRIEVVGDSITAGFGNLGHGPSCTFSAATGATRGRTYAMYAAEALGAEASLVAWSGRGVVRNADPRERGTIGDLYERAAGGFRGAHRTRPASAPDVVVVNAGTNDFAAGPPPHAAFVHAYRALLERARARAPRALLVVMHRNPCSTTRARSEIARLRDSGFGEAVTRARSAGDARVARMNSDRAGEPLGCQWHPSVVTHREDRRAARGGHPARRGWGGVPGR